MENALISLAIDQIRAYMADRWIASHGKQIHQKTMSMYIFPHSANNTGSFEKAKLSQNSETKTGGTNESNRYCEKNRRSRQSCDPKRDSQNHADPGGRPLTENIDTGNRVLLWDAWTYRERVHRVEDIEEPPSDWKSGGGVLMINESSRKAIILLQAPGETSEDVLKCRC